MCAIWGLTWQALAVFILLVNVYNTHICSSQLNFMAIIAIEGLMFYSHHGFYEEEQLIGNKYIVDVYVETDIAAAAQTDDLSKTINYETIFLICKGVMNQHTKLIETILAHIIHDLKRQFKWMNGLRVRVTKTNPPLGGKVDKVWVESNESFVSQCARCQQYIICYNDTTCWCNTEEAHQKTLSQIKEQFGNKCLCKSCIEFYMGKPLTEDS